MMNLDDVPLEIIYNIFYDIEDFKTLVYLRQTCKLYKEVVDLQLEDAVADLLTESPKEVRNMCLANADAARFVVINLPWLLGCHSLTVFNMHAKEAEDWFGVDLSKYQKRDPKYSTGAYLLEVCHKSESLHAYAISHLEQYISPITFGFMKILATKNGRDNETSNSDKTDAHQKKSNHKCTIM